MTQLPPVCLEEAFTELVPEDVLAKRYTGEGNTELLVRWQGKSEVDDSWMSSVEFVQRFPSYKLEGKLGFGGGVLIGAIRCM